MLNFLSLTSQRRLRLLKIYINLLLTRFKRDRLNVLAGHLAYVSLLSLVPFFAVVFSLLTVFPELNEVNTQLKGFLFNNLLPTAINVLQLHIEQFIANAHRMTIIGLISLIITSLLLISSIDSSLNLIWRTKKKRSILFSFVVYCLVIVFGPLLFGGSLVISTYLFSKRWFDVSILMGVGDQALRVFPFCLSLISFVLLYMLVPTVKVKFKDAITGAIITALLFELSKKLFGLYVTLVPTYQIVYGVLAVIPILFIWIYISWCIILFGAQITATLADYRGLNKRVGMMLE